MYVVKERLHRHKISNMNPEKREDREEDSAQTVGDSECQGKK